MPTKTLKEKSFSRLLTWQTAGSFVLQGLGFFTAPLFTRLLTTADYGKVAVYGTWVSLCSIFIGLDVGSSIMRAKIKYSNDEINSYLSSIMTIAVISFVVILGISIIANDFFSKILNLRSDLVILVVLQSFASFCIGFFSEKMMQFKKVEVNILLSLFVSLSGTILAVIFILSSSDQNKYAAKIYANAIPVLLAGFVILCLVFFCGRTLFNRDYWKFCLTLTLPLILHSIGRLVLAQSDRIMLQKMIGESSAGIYSFSYNMASVLAIILTSFNAVWIPFYMEYKKNGQRELILSRTCNYLIAVSVITIGFILLVPEIYKIMAPKEYWPGIKLIPLFALAYYFLFLYFFPINFEVFHGNTKLIPIGTISATIINIVTNFIVIPRYGIMGAAITTLFSYIVLFVFHGIVARVIIKNYEYKFRDFSVGITFVCLAGILFYFLLELWLVRWIIGLILGIFLLLRIIKHRELF